MVWKPPSPQLCLANLTVSFFIALLVHGSYARTKCLMSDRRFRRDDLQVLGHQFYSGSFYDQREKSAYFSGNEIIEFLAPIYNKKFTIELWVNPEGGQLDDVPLLHYYDRCQGDKSLNIWSLGIRNLEKGRDSRFYFTLKTHRVRERYSVTAHDAYRPGIWAHVAVVFNGTSLKLFYNQALVGVSHKSFSPVIPTEGSKCEVLEMGGDSRRAKFFRGTVDDLRIWKKAKSQRAIIADMFRADFSKIQGELMLLEKFENHFNPDSFGSSYLPVTKSGPKLVPSTVPEDLNHIEVKKPLCGVTVCDNPDIIRGYKANSNLRELKVMRYRLINLADDDGQNLIVTQTQIKQQHQEINKVFYRYNITWQLTVQVVKNSTIRKRFVLVGCDLIKIGDKKCNKECDFKQTGNDGGDCSHFKKCNKNLKNNGKCDKECNNKWNNFDDGECCDERFTDTTRTCFDRTSLNRAYWTVGEFRRAVNLDNQYQLNVFPVNFVDESLEGFATFPWENSVFGVEGGTLLQANQMGKLVGVKNMIHEMGHSLGLLHVHHKWQNCDDPCFETHPSLELGDLCADTNPTRKNDECEDPKKSPCGIKYKNTPFKNYMGYGTHCSNEFTKDQVARMHCYADFVYQTWTTTDSPSAIPMEPKVLSYSGKAIKLEWMQSLGMGYDYAMRNCRLCHPHDTTLRQFAVAAHSASVPLESDLYLPHQATGPPDAKTCAIDSNIFMRMDTQSTTPISYLELGFEKEVIPTGIKIWVTYNRDGTPFDIELLHVDNSITYLVSAVPQCDVPYTRRIFTTKSTKRVRIGIHDKQTGIDAVQLISEERHAHCEKCPRAEYIVNREPPFESRQPKRVSRRRFIDRGIKEGITYEYRIQTVVGNNVGPPSLPLKFHTRSGFCGDGIIQHMDREECDDGNLRDGDGCSIHCKHEDVFQCKGQPSICYKYEGDGICEGFEKKISPIDCGFYVPDGFTQQWAVTAVGNPIYECSHSPYDIITGPPPLDLKCYQMQLERMKKAWLPCDFSYRKDDYWIKAGFAEPVVAAAVVVYLASDGMTPFKDKSSKHFIKIKLIDENGNYHNIGMEKIEVHCKRSPLVIPVLHDMTKPYHKTKELEISYSVNTIAITSVALQSSNALNPAIASSCDAKNIKYFKPKAHNCNSYNCRVPKCKPLVISNADISCNGNNDGDMCKVTCSVGYLPAKSTMVKCVLGTWKCGDIKCVPVDCEMPKIKRANVDCEKGTKYRSTCTFHCVHPALMLGVNNKITCMADGFWSVRKASCNLYCPTPLPVENSFAITYQSDANKMKAKTKNEMGTECKFKCKRGFNLTAIQSNAIGLYGKMTCNEDGKWTADSKCVPVRCKELSLFERLVYNCSNGNTFKSVCTTVCPHNQEVHEVRCQEDGKWSSSFDYCKYEGTCSPFSDELIVSACNFNIKGSCKPTCRQKGFDVVLRGKEDLEGITLMCMPGMKWHPPAYKIYCIKSCNKRKMGDGICDCTQNNKHCSYDNGDCCSKGRKRARAVIYRSNKRCKCIEPAVMDTLSQEGSAYGDEYRPRYGDDEDGDDDDVISV